MFLEPQWSQNRASWAFILHISKSTSNEHVTHENDQRPKFSPWNTGAHILQAYKTSSNEDVKKIDAKLVETYF